MVRRLLQDRHGVEIVVGPAGTGKTYALDAARAAWAHSRIDVIGAALAARTARALEAGTGIPKVAQLLADLGQPGLAGLQVQPAGVLNVDEARNGGHPQASPAPRQRRAVADQGLSDHSYRRNSR